MPKSLSIIHRCRSAGGASRNAQRYRSAIERRNSAHHVWRCGPSYAIMRPGVIVKGARMSGAIRAGLIFAAVGLIAVLATAFLPRPGSIVCGPLVAVLVGGLAGF